MVAEVRCGSREKSDGNGGQNDGNPGLAFSNAAEVMEKLQRGRGTALAGSETEVRMRNLGSRRRVQSSERRRCGRPDRSLYQRFGRRWNGRRTGGSVFDLGVNPVPWAEHRGLGDWGCF